MHLLGILCPSYWCLWQLQEKETRQLHLNTIKIALIYIPSAAFQVRKIPQRTALTIVAVFQGCGRNSQGLIACWLGAYAKRNSHGLIPLFFAKLRASKHLLGSLRTYSRWAAWKSRATEKKSRIFSIRITSFKLLMDWTHQSWNYWKDDNLPSDFPTAASSDSCHKKQTKKLPRKYLMTWCFSMTNNIIYDPLCNDMSIIHWKAVLKDIVNKHSWFANRKPEILLWKLRGWGLILET